ncbi:MAG: phosphate ABC transporter substrate-binding protein [Chitinispirillaceae bacterium]
MIKKVAAVTALSVLLVSAVVYAAASGNVTVKGSDTMVILAQRWAEKFMEKNPDVAVQVTGGGSGTGFSAMINGTTDICNASRPIKAKERKNIQKKFKTPGVEIKVAKDGIAIYVNENSPVEELSLDQLKGIFTGTITNWKQIGGNDEKIILYGRDNSSGTYVYFRDNVLKGQNYASTMQSLPGTAAMVNAVAKDKNGIGYGGTAYGKGIKFLKIKKDDKSKAYEPNLESVRTGNYPISRFLYMYLRSRPEGAVKSFIDWILSDEGQEIVHKVGYFPIR